MQPCIQDPVVARVSYDQSRMGGQPHGETPHLCMLAYSGAFDRGRHSTVVLGSDEVDQAVSVTHLEVRGNGIRN